MRSYWGFAASLILGVELCTPPAEACIVEPQAYAVSSTFPERAGSEVPTDAPLVLSMVLLRNRPDLAIASLVPAARIWAEGTGKPVPELTPAVRIGAGSDLVYAFTPGPLEPHTSYWYEFRNGEALLYGGPLLTGGGPAEPIAFEGKLTITYDTVVEPRMLCNESLCGPPTCTPQEDVEVTKAHIQLPRARAGYSHVYARGRLIIARDPFAEDQVDSQQLVPPTEHNEAPTALTLTMPLSAGKAFKPCFLYTVTDASGNGVSDTLCQDVPFPTPEMQLPDNLGEEDEPDASNEPAKTPDMPMPPDPTPPGKHTSQACSVTALGDSSGGAEIAALLALVALSRRRRSRSAP